MSDTPHRGAFIISIVSLFKTPVTYTSNGKKKVELFFFFYQKKRSQNFNHYLQVKKWLHGLKIFGKVASYQSSLGSVLHSNIREELVEVILHGQEENKRTIV